MKNSIFNIRRFGRVLLRDIIAFRGYYIGLICGVFGLFLYFAIQDHSFSGRDGSVLLIAASVLIIVSPIIMNIKRRDTAINTLLPASSFEKYLSLLINNVIIAPFIVLITLYILSRCAYLLIGTSEVFKEDLSLTRLFNLGYYSMVMMFQSVFLLGSLFFKRYAGIKTFLILIAAFLLYRGIVYSLVTESLSIDLLRGYRQVMGDVEEAIMLSEFPEGGFSSVITAMIIVIKTIFPFGLWYAGYFKLKEREV